MDSEFFYKKQIIYAGLYRRILATMIDITLFVFLFSPVKKILDDIIFGQKTESYGKIQSLLQQIFAKKAVKSFSSFIHSPYFTEFKSLLFADHFLYKMVFIQFIQLVAFFAIIMMFWLKKQSTPGKLLLRMRIINLDGQNLTFKQGFMRILGYVLNFLTFGLGCLFILFTKKKQLLQDLTAKTVVIKV